MEHPCQASTALEELAGLYPDWLTEVMATQPFGHGSGVRSTALAWPVR